MAAPRITRGKSVLTSPFRRTGELPQMPLPVEFSCVGSDQKDVSGGKKVILHPVLSSFDRRSRQWAPHADAAARIVQKKNLEYTQQR